MRRLRTVLLAVVAATTLAATTATTTYAGPSPAGAKAPSSAAAADGIAVSWSLKTTGTTARLRGLAPVNKNVAWASGTSGTVLRTVDGGRTWAQVGPHLSAADADLQFRDIEAFSRDDAVIMSIGNGTDSRIYVTSDGGLSWTETFRNDKKLAFYDCMAFSSPTRGLAVSDPYLGKFRIIQTLDGGHSWKVLSSAGMVPALDGEFAFAASGTCLATGRAGRVYLASGGVDPGRILTSLDNGHTWSATSSTIAGGPSSGVFSVQYRNDTRGIAVGGDYTNTTRTGGDAVFTTNGGASWKHATAQPAGYRSGSAWMAPTLSTALAVGPTGSDITTDDGKTWHSFDEGTFDSVECTPDLSCWASGDQGRIATLTYTAS